MASESVSESNDIAVQERSREDTNQEKHKERLPVASAMGNPNDHTQPCYSTESGLRDHGISLPDANKLTLSYNRTTRPLMPDDDFHQLLISLSRTTKPSSAAFEDTLMRIMSERVTVSKIRVGEATMALQRMGEKFCNSHDRLASCFWRAMRAPLTTLYYEASFAKCVPKVVKECLELRKEVEQLREEKRVWQLATKISEERGAVESGQEELSQDSNGGPNVRGTASFPTGSQESSNGMTEEDIRIIASLPAHGISIPTADKWGQLYNRISIPLMSRVEFCQLLLSIRDSIDPTSSDFESVLKIITKEKKKQLKEASRADKKRKREEEQLADSNKKPCSQESVVMTG